jgi:hypothetical protein
MHANNIFVILILFLKTNILYQFKNIYRLIDSTKLNIFSFVFRTNVFSLYNSVYFSQWFYTTLYPSKSYQ